MRQLVKIIFVGKIDILLKLTNLISVLLAVFINILFKKKKKASFVKLL